MAKPYAGYKGNNLVGIVPRAIAFVTEGANKKRFFLFKTNHAEGADAMKKSLAISLIKSGNLSPEQVKEIVAAVAPEERDEVLAVAKGNDPEGAAFNAAISNMIPSIVKEVARQLKKQDGAPEGDDKGEDGEEDEDESEGGELKEILEKLDAILDAEEAKDPDLQKAIEAEEKNPEVKEYAELRRGYEEGKLNEEQTKAYMKAKAAIRKRARATLKTVKLKAEKDAIRELTDPEAKANQDGDMGADGFDKAGKIKKIFEDDREVTDPKEIEQLMNLAQEAVEDGTLA
jgi:hypothetical protein